MYDVAIQASASGRIISRANVKALRKDVLVKCYGGDISPEKETVESRNAKAPNEDGGVEIPQEAFMAVLQLGDED